MPLRQNAEEKVREKGLKTVYLGLHVYYESLKRALKTKTIYGYRCDERLKTNVEESTRLPYTPVGHPVSSSRILFVLRILYFGLSLLVSVLIG